MCEHLGSSESCARIFEDFVCIGIVPLKIPKNGSFCLSNILLVICLAGYDVHQIRTFTLEVLFACVCFLCVVQVIVPL